MDLHYSGANIADDHPRVEIHYLGLKEKRKPYILKKKITAAIATGKSNNKTDKKKQVNIRERNNNNNDKKKKKVIATGSCIYVVQDFLRFEKTVRNPTNVIKKKKKMDCVNKKKKKMNINEM
ncbi:hypothetical protein RFI_08427 [Reticulomyxa filosa]|uniref:Uncharacterized protein n=1 Tax=Reticulomyxa filosa TaxID=46433 RepID=X6NQW6_RETFI|nr:hypothetical protein RFI_08427 [Reticulomyxa filosa]|eukprot:ETO28700.1 hypothetical protein RFI_08427 [Reticulomyxa filosa]